MTIAFLPSAIRCAGLLPAFALCCAADPNPPPLRNAVILLIRHAEKPDNGVELNAEGFQRAAAYVNYFKDFQVEGRTIHLDHLFAARDSKNSERPRLTLTPLSRALKLPLDTRFKDKDTQGLADELRHHPHGKDILICWHHTAIPDLLQALGADPEQLLGKKWPADVFGWVIELRFDHDGKLMTGSSRRINEHLMPDDSHSHAE